jgi:hypothetical protein
MMKLFVRVLVGLSALVALVLGGLGVALVQSAIKPSRTVGVDIVSATAEGTRPVTTVIYYPADGEAKLTWLGLTPAILARGAPVAATSLDRDLARNERLADGSSRYGCGFG